MLLESLGVAHLDLDQTALLFEEVGEPQMAELVARPGDPQVIPGGGEQIGVEALEHARRAVAAEEGARHFAADHRFEKLAAQSGRLARGDGGFDPALVLVAHRQIDRHAAADHVIGHHHALALAGLDAPGAMMLADTRDYLPGDILAKVDRAAMAASLETRVPFLDAELFTLAWRLPAGMKLRDGRTKWVLREVLARHVPPALTERAKAGFAVPLDAWLRGPLRAWADGMLDATRLSRTDLWDTAIIQRLWREHASGAANHQHALWAVLMFEAWREHWGLAA